MRRSRKAQNIIEYMLLVIAVVLVVLVFVRNNGPFSRTVNNMIYSPVRMLN